MASHPKILGLHKRMPNLRLTLATLLLTSSMAFAFEECLEIKDDHERLICFDNAAPSYLVEKALAQAIAKTSSSLNSGPPLTSNEVNNFRKQIMSCWDAGKAEGITVTVLISFFDNGFANENGIGLLYSENVSNEQSLQKAFSEARRAIIACNKNGYDLPPQKYEHWRDIEVTFDPTR